MPKKYDTVVEYINYQPQPQQNLLVQLRTIISKNAPTATQLISYNMPAFKLGKMLLYYAAYKNHIGLYPASSTVFTQFATELQQYPTSKGTIQLKLDKPLPTALLKKIIKFRVKENLVKSTLQKK